MTSRQQTQQKDTVFPPTTQQQNCTGLVPVISVWPAGPFSPAKTWWYYISRTWSLEVSDHTLEYGAEAAMWSAPDH